jgi:hypothetical protein
MHIRLIGFGRQNLLKLLDQLHVVIEHLMDCLERQLDNILNVCPFMFLL